MYGKSLRVSPLLGLLGTLLLLPGLLASQSASGMVLGRYSGGLALVILLTVLAAMVFLGTLLRWKPLRRAQHLPGSLPDNLSVFLAVFPIPAFLLCWFLFPLPLLERWNAFAGVTLLLAVPGAASLEARTGERRTACLRGVAVALVSLLVSLLGAEILLRAVVPGSFFNPRFGLVPYARYTIMVDLPGVSKGGILSTNRWGLRGEEPPADWDAHFTILTVGGSTTANYYLDDSRTWSSVLQENLRREHPHVWVGNGGIPMHSSEHHDLFLREVAAVIRPDMVVFLTGINDIGQFLRGDVATRESPLPEQGARESLFRASRLLQTLYKAKKVYVDRAPVVSVTTDPPFVLLPMPGPERPLPDDLGEMLNDPDLYPMRIRRLIATCRDIGVTPVFLTQPILFEDTPYWRAIQGGSYWHGGSDSLLSAATYGRMLDFLNQQLMDVCLLEGVHCFDLASQVPHDPRVFYDMMHFTEYGAGLVGELLAAYLMESGLLER